MRAAASAHCFFRCSVGATTVTCCTTWWCSSQEASGRANVVLPAPGVATARKSRGCSWMYLSMAACCQARSLLAVPQGARPGKAGDRWCECDGVPAVVVTVSVGVERLRMTTGPPYRRPAAVHARTPPHPSRVGPTSQQYEAALWSLAVLLPGLRPAAHRTRSLV